MAVMQRRRYGTNGRLVIRRAFNGAVAAANAYRRYKSYTDTKTKKRITSGSGVTAQHDSRVVYRKKWMPKYKKRPWKKFTRKVQAVLNKSLASKTIVFNSSQPTTFGSPGTPAASAQVWNSIFLYGNNGDPGVSGTSTTIGGGDLRKCVSILTGISDAVTAANTKIRFSSAVLDITFCHSGSYTGPVELDVYDVVFRKETPNSSIGATIANAEGATRAISPVAGTLTLNSRGVTPFDLPLFLSATGCTILKKVKYFMSVGQAVTYQIRDPRNRTLTKYDITDYGVTSTDNTSGYGSWIKERWTRGVIYIVKPVAGFPDAPITFYAGATRKYLCQLLDDDLISDSYQTA